jgi:hypothetical protein
MLDAANLAWKLAGSVHGWAPPGLLDTYSDERRAAAERTLLHTRAQVALRRGYGPGGDALRALFLELTADEQPLRRLGALMAGTDVGSPTSEAHPLAGTFATDRALHVDHEDPRFASVLRKARPVLLDLADHADLRELAGEWGGRVDVVSATIDERPADALLIRPDALIAWAATVDEPGETGLPALREALTTWFGPRRPRAAQIGPSGRPASQVRPQADECLVQSQTRILAVFRIQPRTRLACRGRCVILDWRALIGYLFRTRNLDRTMSKPS